MAMLNNQMVIMAQDKSAQGPDSQCSINVIFIQLVNVYPLVI